MKQVWSRMLGMTRQVVGNAAITAAAWALVMPTLAAAPPPRDAPARWSQLADMPFKNLMQDAGLPGPIATALATDRDGFLWIGTQAGLARWDGYRFRIYRPVPGDSHALPDSWIQSLRVDARGRLWIGTNTGGLALYDRDNDRFIITPAGPNGLSHVYVRGLEEDGAGGLWIATEGGLDHLNPDTGEIKHLRHVDGDAGSLPVNRTVSVLRDHQGALWVGTPNGLVRRKSEGQPFEPIALPTANKQPAFIRTLYQDSSKRIWVGTMGQGAFLLQDGAAPRALVSSDPSQAALQTDRVLAITEAPNREIWLGTYSGGLYIVEPDTLRTREMRNDPARTTSLANNTVWSLLRQPNGLMWIGTGQGLSRVDTNQAAVLTVYGKPDRKDGISEANVTSILPLADGRVWLGLGANGVDILDPRGRRVGELRSASGNNETTLAKDFVWNMAATAAGDVYLGTLRGLYRAESNGRGLTRLALTRPNAAGGIDAMRLDGDRLWVGSWADGLWLLDVSRKNQTRFVRHESVERLTDRRINAIEYDVQGNLWIGTASGLNYFDLAANTIEKIAPAPDDPQGLPTGSITSLLIDRRGRLWVSTLGAGVVFLEGRDAAGKPRFHRIAAAEGLPNNSANKLLLDARGDIWVSTDDGVARIDANTLAVRALRAEDGLQIPAYWGGAGAVTPEGELLFGGGGGLTILLPEQVKKWTFKPAVVITEARAGKSAVPGVFRFNSHDEGRNARPIEVQADANSLDVEFAALDYTAPARNRYAYRLDGFDRDWIETDALHRTAAYTNLPPGNHVLNLRGSNREGVWSDVLHVGVTVLPAWYQAWWFRLLVLLAAMGAIYAFVQARTAYLRQTQRKLEDMVAERTARLESTLSELAEKSRALEQASLTDPLTGLRNRRFLTIQLETEIPQCIRQFEDAARSGQLPRDADMIFFLIDVDHFKRVNDHHGHAAGDAVLAQMRERLQGVFRESDYLVRWGGEEFLVVARAADRNSAAALAERVRNGVAGKDFVLDDAQRLHITCSVGFAALPFVPADPRALNWADVVDLADIALYLAKHAGRNGWVGINAGENFQANAFATRAKSHLPRLLEAGEIAFESSFGEAVLRESAGKNA